MKAPMRASSFWPAGSCTRCRNSSASTSFRCMVERRFDAIGKLKTVSEAIVKVEVDGEEKMSVAEGHGPVNALDIALRKDLGKFQHEIGDLELVDYKVRILNGGTEAITRVLIEVARRAPARAGGRSASRTTSSTPRSRR